MKNDGEKYRAKALNVAGQKGYEERRKWILTVEENERMISVCLLLCVKSRTVDGGDLIWQYRYGAIILV